ncbi:16S rRNA (guanine(966)-N(2))-methyltransferase RsmD [Buchnera aphidicola]|uniref:Ribosomal RNA small subunit methyltransferase D n=1 Tax=Buchnera aphidicola (Artemisaphis artemisicola) TaxID=1241836 RepID=A0A4D6XIN7_9GAMM|nr:16S rRNA (guanine(966)-N(2))-methyltransferase RsmD [Buchnera aphidicola]QCI15729.1 16S rRNA (guanine(966)-N(2))-methyltransferase RsmD [Buchnera aphidicola (Artemisaphis artemisicola)]
MNNNSVKKKDKVYIISGKFKGRKISFKNISNLRPTTNQIRETLFNWLSKYIKNARCLDCFAGTGSLGIEALSRQAKFLTFLEIQKNTFLNLKKNINELNISNAEILYTNALHWIKKNNQPYDIIFIDPPYYQGLIKKTITLLENNKWIKNNSLVYIEQEKKNIKMSKNWILYKKKITNKIECYLYIFKI